MSLHLIQDLSEAEQVWKELVPLTTIFTDWKFRLAFWQPFNFPVEFYVWKEDEENVGLLPLQFNTEKKYWEFFGGDYMEDNAIFVKPGREDVKVQLLTAVKKPYRLEYIREDEPKKLNLQPLETKFTLDISGRHDLQEALAPFWDTKKLGDLKRKIRKIESRSIKITENNLDDLELLFTLNKKAFEDSSFNKIHQEEIFRNLTKLYREKLHLLTFEIDGVKQAVSMAIEFNGYYEYFNAGVNKEINNLGSFVIAKNIETATHLRVRVFDAFTQESGWKARWHFTATPEYCLIAE